MPVELRMLVWSLALGLVHIVVASTMATRQRGLMWNAGPRDGSPAPLTGVAGRAVRACANFFETFVLFAVAAILVADLHRTTGATALGAQLYFWARVAYLPAYLVGVPFLRTAVWAVAIAGLAMVAVPLF